MAIAWQSGAEAEAESPGSVGRNVLRGARLPQEAIALRAYVLFVTRGGGHGRDWEDWHAAERDLVFG